VLVHPGSTATSRRYPPDLFARAAHLVSARGCRVVFTGSPGEVGLVEDIRRAMGAPSASLAGRLELDELAAVVEVAPVLVTNNTAPAHIAAAVGTPVVELYALTNPQHTPWRVPSRVLFHDVPCRNCFSSVCREGHHLCLRGVEPSAVASAVAEMVARASASAPGDERSGGAAGAGGSGGALVPEARHVVVDADDLRAVAEQPFAQVRTEESRAPGHDRAADPPVRAGRPNHGTAVPEPVASETGRRLPAGDAG
jgi:hypothetical protein